MKTTHYPVPRQLILKCHTLQIMDANTDQQKPSRTGQDASGLPMVRYVSAAQIVYEKVARDAPL